MYAVSSIVNPVILKIYSIMANYFQEIKQNVFAKSFMANDHLAWTVLQAATILVAMASKK